MSVRDIGTPGAFYKFVEMMYNILDRFPHFKKSKDEMAQLLTDTDAEYNVYSVSDSCNINDADELVTYIKRCPEIVADLAANGRVVVANSGGTAYVGYRPTIGDDELTGPTICTCDDPEIQDVINNL